MKIYLARHGDYTINTQNIDVLTEKGERDMQALASFLHESELHVENIFHSVKNRAHQSAELLAQGVKSHSTIQEKQGLAPDDEVAAFADEIMHWDADTLIVGHLPFMGRLLSQLVLGNENKEIVDFQPGTMVCLEQIGQIRWIIRWVLTPQLFK
jgi:phosphohistidine phosphatase